MSIQRRQQRFGDFAEQFFPQPVLRDHDAGRAQHMALDYFPKLGLLGFGKLLPHPPPVFVLDDHRRSFCALFTSLIASAITARWFSAAFRRQRSFNWPEQLGQMHSISGGPSW
jgi:hypothetical protein